MYRYMYRYLHVLYIPYILHVNMIYISLAFLEAMMKRFKVVIKCNGTFNRDFLEEHAAIGQGGMSAEKAFDTVSPNILKTK